MNNREQHVLLRLPSIILATQTQTWSYALDYIDRIARLLSSCGSIIVYRIMINNEEMNVSLVIAIICGVCHSLRFSRIQIDFYSVYFTFQVLTRETCVAILNNIVQSPNMYFDDVTLNVTIKIGDCQQYSNTNQS